jgi:probable HAF family extracellular repeat protein
MTNARTGRHCLLRLLGALLLALAWLAPTASGAQAADIWYVSADGNDDQDCSSPGTACRTLAAALAQAADGDTVHVAAGSYPGPWRPLQSVSVRGAGASATTVGPLAVWNRGTTVAIAGVTITGGVSAGGGGIENSGTVAVTDSVVRDNRARVGEGYQAFGAGVFNMGTMTVLRSTIRDNQAQGIGGDPTTALGGGVHNRGSLTVTDSTISGNTGNVGAGIFNTGTLTLANSTVSGNRARVDGGGVATAAAGVTVLRHVTVAANTSDSDTDGTGDGGGIASAGRTSTTGSILAGNDDTGGQASDCSGSIASQGTNLVGRPAGCSITGTTGTDILGVDPRLAPLADDGGSTATHELLQGSPAIDAARGDECPPTDQRGNRRPQGGACDIGAVEQQATAPQTCPCSLWPGDPAPAVLEDPDRSPVELGVRFRSDVDGFVTGVRFFKGPGNTGPHTGTLWSDRGQRLATGTFTDETASGWQELVFAAPVPVQAATTYVASYHTEVGRYAVDEGYFTDRTVRSGLLQALADGPERGNGVYAYGPSSFPSRSYRASNYWVDVRFDPGVPLAASATLFDPAAVPAVLEDPERTPVELGVRFRSDVDGLVTGVRFFKGPGNTGPHTGTLWSSRGQRLATGTFTDETPAGWQELVFATPVPISARTTYVASYHTEVGRYAVDEGWFSDRPVRRGPLQALTAGAKRGNGVYAPGPSSFPTRSYRASNYWVDVRFTTTTPGLPHRPGDPGRNSEHRHQRQRRRRRRRGVDDRAGAEPAGLRHTGLRLAPRRHHARPRRPEHAQRRFEPGPRRERPRPDRGRQRHGHRRAARRPVGRGRDLRPRHPRRRVQQRHEHQRRRGRRRPQHHGLRRAARVPVAGRSDDRPRHPRWPDQQRPEHQRPRRRGRVQPASRRAHARRAVAARCAGRPRRVRRRPAQRRYRGAEHRARAQRRGRRRRLERRARRSEGGALAARGGAAARHGPVRAGSVATGINDLGLVVGSALVQGERRAVVWRDGLDIDLGTLGGAGSAALAVSDSGTVVGRSTTSAGQTRATVWSLGGTVGGTAR